MVVVGRNKCLLLFLLLLIADNHQEVEPSSLCSVLVEEMVVAVDLPVTEEVRQILH